MVKHIIIWDMKDEFSSAEKAENAAKIKEGLEGLSGKINGLVDIKVHTEFFESSNGDIMLDSTFTDNEALKAYQVNPDHLKVATFVRSCVSARKCVDFEI